jgi:hypothetical protein
LHRLRVNIRRKRIQILGAYLPGELGQVVHRLEVRFHFRRRRVVPARPEFREIELPAKHRRMENSFGLLDVQSFHRN